MINLKELPEDHPYRTTPFRELLDEGVVIEVRNIHKEEWRPVRPGWTIGKNNFNQLAEDPWKTHNEWQAVELS
jgi:hypothetical protein